MPASTSDWPAQDREAASAVVEHHAQLAAGLDQRTRALTTAVEAAPQGGTAVDQARHELLDYLHAELVPHALAEEKALYPAAAEQSAGRLLVDGMLGEHRAIVGLIGELEATSSPVRAAAAARALAAVFATHLAKENDLVLPLIAAAPDVSLADLLAGMHELLGAGAHGGSDEPSGCQCGGCQCGGAAN